MKPEGFDAWWASKPWVRGLRVFGGEDLMRETFRAGMRAAAEIAEAYEPHCESCPRGVVNAILGAAEEGAES